MKPLKKKDLKMKKISILLLVTSLFLISCKGEPSITYKYQDNIDLFSCDAIDMNLIKEAKYAFEDYIEKHYSFQDPKSVDQGYFYYWEIARSTRIPAVEFINPHVLKIRDELKKIDGLWITKNETTTLNYNHPMIKCLSNYMVNSELKRTFDVLTESNTFKEQVFLSLLKRDPLALKNDPALATYLALDTFYARILNLDFSNVEELKLINRNRSIEEQNRLLEKEENGQLFDKSNFIRLDSIKRKN